MKLRVDFARAIEEARIALAAVNEGQACQPWLKGKWTRKQVLGHLIDSAANNRQRFVRAALHGKYTGPDYDQQGWVNIHGYAELPWATLVEWWTVHNRLLERVVLRIPEEVAEVECRVQNTPPMSLREIVEDYIRHLEHHLRQILAR